MKRFRLAASITIMFILSIPLCSYADGYVVHTLSSPVGSYSAAFDINDSGQIVGDINGGDPYAQQAILWNSYNSNPQSLDGGNESAHARLINNAGLVIGEHDAEPGSVMPFKWSATSGVTNIEASFCPEAVNGSGTMVGWAAASYMHEVPVVVSRTGQLTCLSDIWGIARDLNDLGYIIGNLVVDDETHAVVWHEGDPVADIGTFGGTWSSAIGINSSGQVVGVYGGDEGTIGNFIWSSSTETIFTPACSLLDCGSFGPVDINDDGVVLGNAEINGVDTVVTWSSTGGVTIVGTGIAYAINNSGWIVGISDLNDSQAIVWQPVPEPSCILAMLYGIAGFGVLSRYRQRI